MKNNNLTFVRISITKGTMYSLLLSEQQSKHP